MTARKCSQFDLENLATTVKKQIIDLLEPVFGYKKVVATVNVKLNFDKTKRIRDIRTCYR